VSCVLRSPCVLGWPATAYIYSRLPVACVNSAEAVRVLLGVYDIVQVGPAVASRPHSSGMK
jgi:hypothetical protein